jgi:hypothetical protein
MVRILIGFAIATSCAAAALDLRFFGIDLWKWLLGVVGLALFLWGGRGHQ